MRKRLGIVVLVLLNLFAQAYGLTFEQWCRTWEMSAAQGIDRLKAKLDENPYRNDADFIVTSLVVVCQFREKFYDISSQMASVLVLLEKRLIRCLIRIAQGKTNL